MTQNKPKNAYSSSRRFVVNVSVLASFLANFASPGSASAALLGKLPTLGQNDSTTTSNTTPATVTASVDSDNGKIEASISESPSGKIFKGLPAPTRIVSGLVTAYSSTPDQTDSDPFTAASGKRVYDGMIAANGYPFGTKIKIPSLFGDKVFTIDDRMNSRYGKFNFDIWMDAPRHVVAEFAAKRANVEIYLPGELAFK